MAARHFPVALMPLVACAAAQAVASASPVDDFPDPSAAQPFTQRGPAALSACYRDVGLYSEMRDGPAIGPRVQGANGGWGKGMAVFPQQVIDGRTGFLLLAPDGAYFGGLAASEARGILYRTLVFPAGSKLREIHVQIAAGRSFESGRWSGTPPTPQALFFDDSDPDGWKGLRFPALPLIAVSQPEVQAFFEHDLAERLQSIYAHAQADPRYTIDHGVWGPEGYVRFLDRCAAIGGEVERVAKAEKRKFGPALRRNTHMH